MKKILVLMVVLALVGAAVVPVAVFAAPSTTTLVTGNMPAVATITITAPGAVSLALANDPAVEVECGGTASPAGGVALEGLTAGQSYSIAVTGSPANLTLTEGTYLANALMIATGGLSGDNTFQLGTLSLASGVVAMDANPEPYSSGNDADFVSLTGNPQTIGTGLTGSISTLDLYVRQVLPAGVTYTAGAYTTTLTYSFSLNF